MNFSKIIVIGCPGSGKSRFSRKLAELTGLPLHHLDMMYWNPDRTTVGREVFRARLADVLSRDEWIIDGNYNSTVEIRLAACERVFFFDYPTELCLKGLDERRGMPRPDMPWIETEPDAEFLDFVRNFHEIDCPKLYARLAKFPQLEVTVFESREQTDAYLASLTSNT